MASAYPFASLARTVWSVQPEPECLWMIAYKAYYDASGRDQVNGRVVVVGAVSRVDKWPKFEARWDAVLDEFGITHHHHKDYAPCNGEFAKWKGNHPDRTAYAAALLKAYKLGIQKTFLVAIADDSIKAVVKNYEGFFSEDGRGAYALAGNVARRAIEQWLSEKGEPFSVHHVFEHGDNNQDLLRNIVDHDHPDDYDGYTVLKKKDKQGRYVRPFEACDFMAWEARRLIEDNDAMKAKMPRGVAFEIAKHLPVAGFIPTTERMLEIAERGVQSGHPTLRRRDG